MVAISPLRRSSRAVRPQLPALVLGRDSGSSAWAPRLCGLLGQVAAVSVARTLVTAPIVWWHFGREAVAELFGQGMSGSCESPRTLDSGQKTWL